MQDLRSELENLISINNDIRQDRLERQGSKAKEDSRSMMSTTMTKSIFSETKNASFLNQELIMFVENLHQKATQVGLREDALIPQQTSKEKRIYNQVRSSIRPQSAVATANGQLAGTKKARENSPTQTAMRSSFYSMSMLNEDEKAEMDAEDDVATLFKQEQERRGAVLDQLNITNILELSQRDHEVLTQIKNFMTQQESELQAEISVMQKLMVEQATQHYSDDDSA